MTEEAGCKLFIGGLSWETSEEKLREYFEAFGEVVETPIMKDKNTGRPRGFGFVVFKDPQIAEQVAADKHTIDGRQVEAKLAVPRSDNAPARGQQGHHKRGGNEQKTKKIFVGGLAPTTDEATFKEYFSQFGDIDDVVVMYDQTTQRPRGFGFVTFTNEEAVDRVFQIGAHHELQEKKVEIKRAVPKESMPPGGSGKGGGKGGGRDGYGMNGGKGGGRGVGGYGGGMGGYGGAQQGYGGGYGGGYAGGYGNMGPYGFPAAGGYPAPGYAEGGFAGYGGGYGDRGGMGYPGAGGTGAGYMADGVSPYGAYGGMVAAQYGSAAAGAGYTNDTSSYGGASYAGAGPGDFGRYGATTRDTSGRSERTFRPY